MRKRLTPEEREIRSGSGFRYTRVWTFPVLFLAMIIIASDSDLMQRCTGDALDAYGRNKIVGLVRMALVVPCSPYLITGSLTQILMFVALWLPVPFAIINWRFARRHKAYWDERRARDKARRAKRAAERKTVPPPDA